MTAAKHVRTALYRTTARKLARLAARITGREWAVDSELGRAAKPLRQTCQILDAAWAGDSTSSIEDRFEIELLGRLAAAVSEEAALGAAHRQKAQRQWEAGAAARATAEAAHAASAAAARRLTPEWLARRGG